MKKWTFEEAKELLNKHNGSDRYGTVFDSVLKTVVDMVNTKGGKGKKDEESKEDPEQT